MRAVLIAVALAALAATPATAQDAAAAPSSVAPLLVGVSESRPFAYRDEDGTWTGLSIALWEQVADRIGARYELHPLAPADVDAALVEHRVDAALGEIPVTPEAQAVHDFSQPYLITGLGFAQRRQESIPWGALARALADPRLITVVSAIVVAVLVVGVIIALIERRARTTDFGGPLRESVSTGVWWAAVTMTTVGYGDATPKTVLGRALALVWMFVGVIAVAILTATVTSVLTVSHLRGTVEQPADLFRLRLGAVAGGAGTDYLDHRHVAYTPYPTHADALIALDAGAIDAAVADIPMLRSLVSQSWTGRLQVSPIALEPILYAVALPESSPLTTRINRALLAVTHDDSWRDTEERFLGHR